MRKMKRLFKARNRFIPWYHWSIIHCILNMISFVVFYATMFFMDNTVLMLHWFLACLIQFVLIFLILFIAWIFERKLSKNALAIIKRKLEESQTNFKDIDISIKESKLYSCTINVNHGIYTKKQIDELLLIVYDINRKLGNGYNIVVDSFQYNNAKKVEK